MRNYVPSILLGLSLDIAHTFSEAIDYCAKKKEGRSAEEVLQLLAQGDRWAHSTFRYALTTQVCQYLSRLGTVVRSVYIFGSSMSDGAKPTSDIDIIIWVNERSDAIAFLLDRLNLFISTYYRGLFADRASRMRRMFDIHLVDDQEVKARVGYGAVLGSLHTRPVKIWAR